MNRRKKKKIINRNGFRKYSNYKLYKAIDEFCIDKYGKDVYDRFRVTNETKGYKRNMIFVKYKKKIDYKHISDVRCFFDVIPYGPSPFQNKPEEFIHTVKNGGENSGLSNNS